MIRNRVGMTSLLLAGLGMSQVALATTVPMPSVLLAINNNQFVELPQPQPSEDGKTWFWEFNGYDNEPRDLNDNEPDFMITSGSAFIDPDPIIVMTLGVIDFGAPTTFAFTIVSPLLPTITKPSVETSFNISMTDAGSDGVSATAIVPDSDSDGTLEIARTFLDLTNMGVDVGPSVAAATPGGSFGPYIASAIGPAGSYTTHGFSFTFTGSGGGDAYSLDGRSVVTQIPLPAAVWAGMALLGSLAGVQSIRRRMSR